MEIKIDRHTLRLLADGAAFNAETRTLFVADLHLGKTTVFREAGLALPEGPDATILDRLAHIITSTGAETLVILGDVFHARACGIEATLAKLRAKHPEMLLQIVPGNHDRRIPWSAWLPGAEILTEGECVGAFRVAHFPSEKNGVVTLCGHLHPGIVIGKTRERKLRLPCFWFRRGALVLPAFGEFTGLGMIERERGDRVWVGAAGKVVEIPQSKAPAS